MTVFKKIKSKLLKGAQNNLSLAIYSIIIAILLWFVISMTFYPSVPKTIENVAVSYDISGTPASESDLAIIDCDVDTVKVRLKGSRTQVGKLNSDSLSAYIDVSNITTPGKKTVPIKVKSTSSINYEIDSIVPSAATVTFDKFVTKELPIKPQIPKNVQLAENKIIESDGAVCEPDVISITGPSAQLDKITNVYAISEKLSASSEQLSASFTTQSDAIKLYDKDGSEIYNDKITFDQTNFLIKVPVLTKKTVPLSYQLNAPKGFDTEWLKNRISLSADTIILASGNAQTELPDTFDIGSIKLNDIGLDYSPTFDISSSFDEKNLKNLSSFNNVTVKFDSTDLESKNFYINNFNVLNKPSGNFDYNVITDTIKVTVIGPKETLSELTSNDFTADVDLLVNDTTLSSDNKFTADVTVSCSAHNRVWAVGKYTVQILKTSKEATSESTN